MPKNEDPEIKTSITRFTKTDDEIIVELSKKDNEYRKNKN